MNFKAPRGTHDIWGEQAENLHRLEESCRRVFAAYNYAEMRVPAFEDAGLFTRSIGETTDIVEKEMYVFEDRKGRKLALRPEGTASVVRAYLEHQLAQALPVAKLFYSGSMFRYERPQAGRYREFSQIGAEYFGNPAPSADAEMILLAHAVLRAAGLDAVKVHINTLGCAACRPAFRAALSAYFAAQKDLCADCLRRMDKNPLRLLDCKIDGPRFSNLPRMEDFLCGECTDHFTRVRTLLDAAGCVFHVDHRLVRGLDYYTRTIFEIRSAGIGSQDALAAGGRYDRLVEELGGSPTPGVGFALGSERVLLARDAQGAAGTVPAAEKVLVAVAGREWEAPAFKLAASLRAAGVTAGAPVTIEGPFAERSLKSQMKLADRLGVDTVYIVGDEFTRGMVTVRNMKTKVQEERPVDRMNA